MQEERRSDDLLMGELMAKVNHLAIEVNFLREKTDTLIAHINAGRGMFFGAIFGAGGLGAGLSQVMDKFI